MRRIFFFLSTTLLACASQTSPDKNSNADSLKTDKISKLTSLSNDTTYTPLTIKVDNTDSVTIKREYYNPTDFNYYHELIFLNGKQVYVDTSHYFDYESKYNRVIKEKGNLLLFLENDGRPNFNYISAYSISGATAVFVSDCVYNDSIQRKGPAPFTDIDKDGFLEYGGFDLTEGYNNDDSMYYIPSDFYEIRNGKVQYDSALTKAMDIKENGVYIANPIDMNGNCCVVIRKPKRFKK